jgi:hypothetical protein
LALVRGAGELLPAVGSSMGIGGFETGAVTDAVSLFFAPDMTAAEGQSAPRCDRGSTLSDGGREFQQAARRRMPGSRALRCRRRHWRIERLCADEWRFRGSELLFGRLLQGCFVPFQAILIPTARVLTGLGLFGSLVGLLLVHVAYGISRDDTPLPRLLSRESRRDSRRRTPRRRRILFGVPPRSLAALGAHDGGRGDSPVHWHLERLPIRSHVLRAWQRAGASFGAREYNVDVAAALLTAPPTLAVYVLSGRYFYAGSAPAP